MKRYFQIITIVFILGYQIPDARAQLPPFCNGSVLGNCCIDHTNPLFPPPESIAIPYVFLVPQNFFTNSNPTIIVGLHGHIDVADTPFDPYTAPEPIIDCGHLAIDPDTANTAAVVLSEGNAIVIPWYKPGYPFGAQTLEAVESTQEVTKYFNELVPILSTLLGQSPPTADIVLLGCSQGGYVALKSLELFPEDYNGAIAQSPPNLRSVAGAFSTFAVAYDVAFGWDTALWGAVDDVRAALDPLSSLFPVDFENEVWPEVTTKLNFLKSLPSPLPIDEANDNLNLAGVENQLSSLTELEKQQLRLWEFIRKANALPVKDFYPRVVGGVIQRNGYIASQFYFSTEGRAEFARLWDNSIDPSPFLLSQQIKLSGDDNHYLQDLGLKKNDTRSLVQTVNERTNPVLSATFESALLKGDFSGILNKPLLWMHGSNDGELPVYNASIYQDTVVNASEAAGIDYNDNLIQVFSNGGHCTFNAYQNLAGLDALKSWIDTGKRPDPKTFFPSSFPDLFGFYGGTVQNGFLDGYHPPQWPYVESSEPPTSIEGRGGGCSFASVGAPVSLPLYLLVPVFFVVIRRVLRVLRELE